MGQFLRLIDEFLKNFRMAVTLIAGANSSDKVEVFVA
jgi:hypothetical protein